LNREFKLPARGHETHLVNDLERVEQYHHAARELAAEAKDRNPQFTDKERINLEIYAERLNEESERENYLGVARGHDQSQDREVSVCLSRQIFGRPSLAIVKLSILNTTGCQHYDPSAGEHLTLYPR